MTAETALTLLDPSGETQWIKQILIDSSHDLPEGLDDQQEMAVIVQRAFSRTQLQANERKSLQVWIADWAHNNTDVGQIWQSHPEGYSSLGDFLKAVGSVDDGTQLSPAQISYMTSIAEVISPWCKEAGIDVRTRISGRSWSRFREAIPVMKRIIRSETPQDEKVLAVNAILSDVDSLPRDAIREKYRLTTRTEKYYIGDTREIPGERICVCLVVPKDVWEIEKGKFSKFTEWKNITLKTLDKVFVPIPLLEE